MSIFKTCVYCGEDAKLREHVMPQARGGKWVVPGCWSCNTSKGGRTPEEWIAALFNEPRAKTWQVKKRLPFLIEHGIVDPVALWAQLDCARDEHFHILVEIYRVRNMLDVSQEDVDVYWEVENAIDDASRL